MKRILAFALTFISHCLLLANPVMFKHIDMTNGLSNNSVSAILKDKDGFMWFATAAGLNRYDGYNFKVYRHIPDDAHSLPDHFISDMAEMPDGRLWVKTGKGYVLLNKQTDEFQIDLSAFMEALGSHGVPDQVIVDREGTTWIVVFGEGCYRYDAKGKSAYFSFTDNNLPLSGVTNLKKSKIGVLLAYDSGKIACFDERTMRLKWVMEVPDTTEGNRVHSSYYLYVDRENVLWIYSGKGLWAYDLLRKQWRNELTEGVIEEKDLVHSITQDAQGNIWFGKDFSGITILNKTTRKKTHLLADDYDSRSLPHNTVYCLYTDRENLVWVGMYKKGISYYGSSIYKFGLYHLGDVTFIADAGNHNLLLGTNDKGLLLWNEKLHELVDYPVGKQINRPIVCALKASDGKVWAGTFNGGLYCIDNGRIQTIAGLASHNVWSLVEDIHGKIWVGLLDGGIQKVDAKTMQVERTYTDKDGLVDTHISTLCFADMNTLIIGYASGGIQAINITTNAVENVIPERLSKNITSGINQVLVDSRGLLWIASRGGLYVYNRDTKQLTSLNENFMYGGGFIAGITEDQSHNMWVSSIQQLVHLKVSRQGGGYAFKAKVYASKDGLQNSDFNLRSIMTLSNGEIVAGGLYGINVFVPTEINYNKFSPQVFFTELRLLNDNVEVGKAYDGRTILKKTLSATESIELNYDQNIFTLSFASDNMSLPENTTYRYYVEGMTDNWLTLPQGVHTISFTNLPYGTYVVKVKAINSDGVEGKQTARLKIVVHPPFWFSWWAYLLYVAFVIALLWYARRYILQKERERFHLKQLEEEAVRREELNNMKFRFFTNISHELRTPLTLIISPLEKMLKETANDGQKQKLQLMYRNAQRLLLLVNQLLDFRKGEMSGHKLNLTEGDVVDYIQGVCSSFLLMAENKNIHFSFFSATEHYYMAFDVDKVGKIIMNLLSNAFKFTPQGGRVSVLVELVETDTPYLEIKVSDTGKGIKDEDKEHIFERFYQVDHSGESGGSGIGLSLVSDFVALHGGEIKVYDNIGSGTVFIVELPIRHVDSVEFVKEEGADTSVEVPPASVSLETADVALPTLLIVDDNEDFRLFLKDSLEAEFNIEFASNGKEAWEKINQKHPALVVSDVMMPEMDGTELCQRIKGNEQTKHIPVILLTAKHNEESKVEGLQLGADDYLTKPFNMTILLLRIHKLIELNSQVGEQRALVDPTPSDIEITPMDEKLIQKAVKYVEDHISKSDLSVEELSRELGMSRVHLYKKLLPITGKTPIEFIRVIRLKRAAQLLRESQMNISEIAYEVGFNNPKYFSRYFKDEFGVLPSVYQEKEGK